MEPPATTLPPPGEVTRGEELASDPVDGSTPTDEGTEEPVSDARATPPSGGGPGDVQPTRLAGTAELSGEHQAVQSVMNHHLGRIQHCYTTELRNRPDLAGRIEFELHVDAEGAVSQVLATSSTFEDPAVEQCLVPVLSELRFPGLGETTFTYPFIFQSQ